MVEPTDPTWEGNDLRWQKLTPEGPSYGVLSLDMFGP